ncbi:MAG: TolC family protein [Saprospiraceae bacterium]
MFKFKLLLPALLIWSGLSAADTLGIEQVRALARASSPLQQIKTLNASYSLLENRQLKSDFLPNIQFRGQASYQSDVFTLPIDNPLFPVPEIPKDQYNLSANITQRIYDGGAAKLTRVQNLIREELESAQTDGEVYKIEMLVTELYANALLLQESIDALQSAETDLVRRKEQIDAMVREGVALRTAADEVLIAQLKLEEQIQALEADFKSLKEVIALWTNRENADFELRMDAVQETSIDARPEMRQFTLTEKQIHSYSDLLSIKNQPKLEAFAQGGLGSPNPLNFFETDFQPYAMVGLRAVWTPIHWGNTNRDRQLLEIKSQQVSAKRDAFEKSYAANKKSKTDQAAKFQNMVEQDKRIIELHQSILERAEAQQKNGVITTTEYLSKFENLTQAQLTLRQHEVQAWRANQLAQL